MNRSQRSGNCQDHERGFNLYQFERLAVWVFDLVADPDIDSGLGG